MFKKIALLAATASLTLGFAATASAQSLLPATATGKIVLNGHVPAQCSVIVAGSPPSGADFGNTVDLGVLSDANGHLVSGLTAATNQIGTQAFQVNCTGANNTVTLVATPLTTAATAPSGYANTINYTAQSDFAVVGGTSPVTLTQASTVVTPLSQGLGAGVRLANPGNNITITAYSFNTASTATDILVAGAYTGTITVTVSAGV